MEIIKVTTPHSGQETEVKISPEMFGEKQAWRVVFDDGKEEILGLDDHDAWQQLRGTGLDPALVKEIGKAIENAQEDQS